MEVATMGWDADDVVSLVEDAAERRYMSEWLEPEETISPTEHGRRARLESLRLSKIHTKERLKRATNPVYREMLERALRHLEAEMLD
jgi:hypothetical protein